MYLWTAFTIGILGSLHCVGMCGPIALALPYQSRSTWTHLKNAISYNGGHILASGVIGVLPGLLGYGLSLAGIQKSTSLVIGISLLLECTDLDTTSSQTNSYSSPRKSK